MVIHTSSQNILEGIDTAFLDQVDHGSGKRERIGRKKRKKGKKRKRKEKKGGEGGGEKIKAKT